MIAASVSGIRILRTFMVTPNDVPSKNYLHKLYASRAIYVCKYSRTSMARTSLGPCVRDMGSSSH